MAIHQQVLKILLWAAQIINSTKNFASSFEILMNQQTVRGKAAQVWRQICSDVFHCSETVAVSFRKASSADRAFVQHDWSIRTTCTSNTNTTESTWNWHSTQASAWLRQITHIEVNHAFAGISRLCLALLPFLRRNSSVRNLHGSVELINNRRRAQLNSIMKTVVRFHAPTDNLSKTTKTMRRKQMR